MNTIEKVEQFLQKYYLLEKNNSVIVAFSGGYDSMCLLDIINKLSKKYNFKPIAIHLNHNWRGEESRQDEQNCQKFSQDNNVEFYCETLSSDVPKNETSAREERYKFFEKCADKFNSKCILTAHNADDNAETVLYRIVKGTGISGLEGIKEKREIFYRPLLSVYREEIENYCKENNLKPNIDSSNSDTKYKRNLIRHEIFPLLEKINTDFKSSINSLSQIASSENEYFENIIKLIKKDNCINTKDFSNLDLCLKQRVIHSIYHDFDMEYDREKIEYILNFIEANKNSKSGKTCSLTTNLWLFTSNKEIKVIKKNESKKEAVSINACGEYQASDFTFSIIPHSEISEFPKDCENTAIVNLDAFEINFTLRNRQEGDIIQPLGVSGTQKLKKYLNNKKVPNYQKDSLLFLCKDNEVLWAPSLGISDKIKVVNKPTHVLKLEKSDIE